MDFTIIIDFLKDFYGVIIAFLMLGGQWYWNNKKTKSQLKTEQIDNENREEDRESKEIQNMKDLFNLFQTQFKTELLSKQLDNKSLSDLVSELKTKVDILSEDVKKLTNFINDRDREIEEVAKKCYNRKKEQACIVLEHLSNNKNIPPK
jgi:hydroxymethylpyrimidine pyrophosphatase-like HAD family hydrolase